VPEQDRRLEQPEQLLVGADRPRPLPAHLRARLEQALAASGPGEGDVPRPVPAEARDKLENSLAPGLPRRPKKRVFLLPALGAAAAVAVALAVGLPALVHGPRTGSNGASAFNAAAPPAEHTRLSPERSALGVVPGPAHAGTGAKSLVPAAGASAAQASAGAPTGRPLPAVPVVASVSPRTGPVRGGNWVGVEGTALGKVTAVYFGGIPATKVIVESSASLKALAPAHAAGTVDVVVSGGHGRSKVSAGDHYLFGG
jgi:IPT/TIG domain